jgi:DNA-binding MarR family transcriptional regulator
MREEIVCTLTVSLLTFTAMTKRVTQPPASTASPAERPLAVHLEEDGVDELSAQTFRAFIAAMRLHGRLMMGLLADGGAHPGQVFCLRVVAGSDGITQRDLAEELHIARPTVTRMLQGLERAGLVERRSDERDKRLTRVYLTERGRELEAKVRAVAATYVRDTLGRLPAQDRRELARLLDEFGATIAAAIVAHKGDAA